MADVAPNNGDRMEVTDTLGRKITLKTLGPADLLNLFEAAGSNSGNAGWMRLAMELSSVRQIGELPFPVAVKKDQLLLVAERLGNEGLVAVHSVLFPDNPDAGQEGAATDGEKAEAEAVDIAKN